jgi:hypothetical protein
MQVDKINYLCKEQFVRMHFLEVLQRHGLRQVRKLASGSVSTDFLLAQMRDVWHEFATFNKCYHGSNKRKLPRGSGMVSNKSWASQPTCGWSTVRASPHLLLQKC